MMEYLTEHLNSEIVLGTIPDTSVAINWVQSTYLHVRIKKNPSYYLPNVSNVNNVNIDNELNTIIMKNLHKLVERGMVVADEDFWGLNSTDLGVVMAHYYISFEVYVTIKKTYSRQWSNLLN
jgi:ATP-dependent DNA helicase HFM1/MER3